MAFLTEKLDLVKVNYDAIGNENSVKVVNNVVQESDNFKKLIEMEFPDLFHSIGCMDGEISIKLCKGGIPHTEPIRHVPQCMQEPLKAELDKLCKEGILLKMYISEPTEWLNSFVCVCEKTQWQNQTVS